MYFGKQLCKTSMQKAGTCGSFFEFESSKLSNGICLNTLRCLYTLRHRAVVCSELMCDAALVIGFVVFAMKANAANHHKPSSNYTLNAVYLCRSSNINNIAIFHGK